MAGGLGFTSFCPIVPFAAFAAIWERFLGASFAALAAPPLRSTPRRPRATAWGFLDGSHDLWFLLG